MIPLYFTLLTPVFGIFIMLIFGHRRIGAIFNIIIIAGSFLAAIFLAANYLQHGVFLSSNQQFYIDAFNLLLILLTTFVATTTAIFSKNYMLHNLQSGRISKQLLRLYHIMYQVFIVMMLLSLSTNNIGILWVAMEGATLATVLLVSLYRTPQAIEAAWKYFILCIVGIALALFGTILIYSSAAHLFTDNNSAMLWSVLDHSAKALNAPIIKLAFVFLLVGYGTKIGLVPLHNWLPDAHSESPAPMSTLLSGLLLNVALYALVRFKILTDLALNNHLAGYLMMGFGLLSFMTAALLLHRQNNIKRLFSYSSIEHMGLITFGFGLGGPLATFGAIFYMIMHSLIKSALFVTVGNIIRFAGTQSMEKIRGLIREQPAIGWGLLLGSIAISGFPPFGIFISEVMLFFATIKILPWLALLLLIGLIIALAGIFKNIQQMVYGEPIVKNPCNSLKNNEKFNKNAGLKNKGMMIPAFLHLGLAFILGVYIPPVFVQLLNQATTIIAGQL